MRHGKASYAELESLRLRMELQAGAERLACAVAGPTADHSRIRVLIADDHAITRRWLFQLIQHERGMEIVGLASDGPMAVEMVRLIRPEVVILGFEMSGMSKSRWFALPAFTLPDHVGFGVLSMLLYGRR